MATDNFNSFAETCERFGNIAQYDAVHLDVVGAFHRLAELHKHEIAAKDDERLTIVANYENVIVAKDRIIAAKDAEIARMRECLKAAAEFAAEMKESTKSLMRACGHQMILRLREEGAEDEGK